MAYYEQPCHRIEVTDVKIATVARTEPRLMLMNLLSVLCGQRVSRLVESTNRA